MVIRNLNSGKMEYRASSAEVLNGRGRLGDVASEFAEDGVHHYFCDGERWIPIIQTQFNGNVSTGGGSINTGNAKQIKVSREVQGSSRARESAPYFGNPPFYVGPCDFENLGTAFEAAWLHDEDHVWLNGQHIEGEPAMGDILSVRWKKWRVIRREDLGYTSGSAYLLERITNPAAYVDTPPLRTVWE